MGGERECVRMRKRISNEYKMQILKEMMVEEVKEYTEEEMHGREWVRVQKKMVRTHFGKLYGKYKHYLRDLINAGYIKATVWCFDRRKRSYEFTTPLKNFKIYVYEDGRLFTDGTVDTLAENFDELRFNDNSDFINNTVIPAVIQRGEYKGVLTTKFSTTKIHACADGNYFRWEDAIKKEYDRAVDKLGYAGHCYDNYYAVVDAPAHRDGRACINADAIACINADVKDDWFTVDVNKLKSKRKKR